MANFEAEISELTIEDTGYGHLDISAEIVEGKDLVQVKIDGLILNINLNIATAMIFELADALKYKLTDLE